MSDRPATPSPDLAALLCSRLCHDVIGPIGAILNGIELLEDEDPGDLGPALQLIKRSAEQVSARVQFARIAYGAAGSQSAIELAEIERLTGGLYGHDGASLAWSAPREGRLPLASAKLLMNTLELAAQAIPRGGEIAVSIEEAPGRWTIRARGKAARIPASFAIACGEERDVAPTDSRSLQALLVRVFLARVGATLALDSAEEEVTLRLAGEALAPA